MTYDEWKSTDPADRRTATGPREEPTVESPRGTPCSTCGRTIHRVYTLAGVGAFCSPGCRAQAAQSAQSDVA